MLEKILLQFILLFVFSPVLHAYDNSLLENCEEYIKYGVPGQDGTLLCRKGYLLAHDSERKTPIWVAEHLINKRVTGVVKRTNFQPDPDLNIGKRAELIDYRGSGYDRGHMAPAGNMRWGQQAMLESFFLSNIVPQIGKDMNQGIWKELEEKIRLWAISRGELYIYTGPIYAKKPPDVIGINKVAIPTHLYKIIYDPIAIEAIAFIMPNMKLKSSDMPAYIVTIREIEKKTGLNFLSTLDTETESIVELVKARNLWTE